MSVSRMSLLRPRRVDLSLAAHKPSPPLLSSILPFLCLLLSLLCSPPVTLVRAGSNGGQSVVNDYIVTSNTAVLPDVSQLLMTWLSFRTNEAPNLQVALPFSFPFFGNEQSEVYLSPNGAVQFDNSLECCEPCGANVECCSFMNYQQLVESTQGPVSACSFAVNYNNLLALSLTDSAPAANGASVGYGWSPSAWQQTGNDSWEWDVSQPVVIQYRSIPMLYQQSYEGGQLAGLLNPTGVNFTFGCGLYASGRIDFYYWSISDPVLYGDWGGLERLWLVGLRQPAGRSQSNQYLSEYSDPNTGWLPSNGTYLDRQSIHNGTTFTFWPIGHQSCVVPPVAPTTGNSTIAVVLVDYLNSTAAFEWQCHFVGNNLVTGQYFDSVAPAAYDDSADALRCSTPAAPVKSSMAVFLLADGVALPITPSVLTYVYNTSSYSVEIWESQSSFAFLELFCSSCGSFRPSYCWYDCSGTLHGAAVIDSCGACVEGNTGRPYNGELDCDGNCYGTFEWVGGECICPGGYWCTELALSTQYIQDSPLSYIWSINGSVMAVNASGDEVVHFNDSRFAQMPYGFSVFTSPYPFYLQFGFRCFSSLYDLVYISPLGAIYLTLPSANCLSQASIMLYDGVGDCIVNLIAGYLAEFDGLNSGNAVQFAYLTARNVFCVRYNQLHLAQSPSNSTTISFIICLYPSGRVTVDYVSIVPPSLLQDVPGLPYTRRVLVGIMTYPRGTYDLLDAYPSPYVTSSIYANGLYALRVENEWLSTTLSSGVFPPKALLWGSGTVDFIPFGVNLCLAPFFGSSAGGQLLHINPSQNSVYLPYLQLECVVAGAFYRAWYNPLFGSFDCIMPDGEGDSTVAVGLASAGGYILTTNRVYYAYYDPWAAAVQNSTYALAYRTAALCSQCYSNFLAINTVYCYLDCANDWRGGAFRDDCGSCVGGETAIVPGAAKDCYGTCYGQHRPVRVGNSSICLCPLPSGQTAATSRCAVVPVIQPTPNVVTQYIDTFNASALLSAVAVTGSNITGERRSSPSTLVAVELPFSFPYFGAQYRQLFIDTDGAVYLTNTTAECVADGSARLFSADQAITTKTCLYMIVAGALTDYSANGLQPSVTSYSVLADRLVVQYEESVQQFAVVLADDGSINVAYSGVRDSGGAWLVGVRFGVPGAVELMPFPYILTADAYPPTCGQYDCSYSSLPTSFITAEQASFLPNESYTSGYYPTRSRFAAPTSGTLTFCPLSIFLCLSPQLGRSKGNTLLTFYSNITLCSSSSCCALRLNMTCNMGGVTLPAWYNQAVGGWQCRSAPGVPNTVVSVWLEESGRQIGMASPLFFTYNDSAVLPVTATDSELQTCLDCSAYLTAYCWQDCTGTFRGNATVDGCMQCEAPGSTTAVSLARYVVTTDTSPYLSALDCLGVCFGPFTSLYHTAVSVPSAPLPQCGCSIAPEPVQIQRQSFAYTTLCAVWQRLDGGQVLRSTLNPLQSYQIVVFVLCMLVLSVAGYMEAVQGYQYVRRRMKMTPEERARERRRRERRRQRERDRRERRRRVALGLPMSEQDGAALPPGVAAIALPPPAPSPPEPAAAPAAPPVAPQVPVTPPTAPGLSRSEQSALVQLHGMGFNDDAALLRLVRQYKANVGHVLEHLLR